MSMGDLGNGQKRKQRQTQERNHRKSTRLCGALTLGTCLKCVKQDASSSKNTQYWMRCICKRYPYTGSTVLCCGKTMSFELRLNCGIMAHLLYFRRLLLVSLAALAVTSVGSMAQEHQPVPLKPGVPGMGSNHRLILKDGTFQMVRQYEIVGDRVRYLSQERGEWEDASRSCGLGCDQKMGAEPCQPAC